MRIACARFAGSITANCAFAGVVTKTRRTVPIRARRIIWRLLPSESSGLRLRISRQLQVARQIHLDAVAFANRDGRQTIQEAAHDLKACLRRCVSPARDDDGPISRAT